MDSKVQTTTLHTTLLDNDNLKRILLYLYGYQTTEEQQYESTVEQNGVGFNMIDANILSSFAQQVIAGRELSPKQYNLARLMLPKYHNQTASGAWQAVQLPTVTHTNGAKPNGVTVSLAESIIKNAKSNGGQAKPLQADTRITGVLDVDTDGCLMFTPNVYPSKQIKTIGFSKWDGKAWHQWHPKVFETAVNDVRKLFGNIQVTDAVLQAIAPKPLVELPPWIRNDERLLEYQKEAIQFTATAKHILLGLAPRLGKSVVTILAAKMLGLKRILVICPLSNLRDWQNKIKYWGDEPANIVYKKNLPVPGKWTITNYDTIRLHPETFEREQWELIVIDESLLIKNRKTKRTDAIHNLVRNTKPEYCWLLSGNPKAKYYSDMWSQFHTLDFNRFSSFWRFVDRYCVREENQWSKYNIVGNKPDAAANIKEDQKDIYFSRLQEEVTNMPPMEPENFEVAMSVYQDKLYHQMEDSFMAELDDETTLSASIVLTQMLRLVQIASNPLLVDGKDDGAKWDAVVEMLQFEPHPVIVWTNFIETAEQMRLRLISKEWAVAKLTGATKPEERQQIVDDFQAGKINVLLAHPAVGKYGLDLYNAKSVIYLERSHNTDDYYQSLNRVRHIAQTQAPHIVHLLATRQNGGGTIDHVIDELLHTAKEDTKKITAGRIKSLLMENRNG